MRSLFLISVVCLQFCYSYGVGVGAYAYQDTAGNRYGGTYDLRDGQVDPYNFQDAFSSFGPDPYTGFQDLDSFFPEYFRNLENLVQELDENRISHKRLPRFIKPMPGFPPFPSRRAFSKNIDQQQKALDAARKAYDLTSNRAGYMPYNDFDRFGGIPSFRMPAFPPMPEFPSMQGMQNTAFAGAAAGPGFSQHRVALSPSNKENIDVTQFSDRDGNDRDGFYSVKSSSFVSSSNINGRQATEKGGETVINDNGRITKYSLND